MLAKIQLLNEIANLDEDSNLYKAICLLIDDKCTDDESCGLYSTYSIELIKSIRLQYKTSDEVESNLDIYKPILDGDISKLSKIAAHISVLIDRIYENKLSKQ